VARTPTRTADDGSLLRLLVLAPDEGGCAAVDLDSGAFVRAEAPGGEVLEDFAPYDVVETRLAGSEEPPDPARPEAVVLAERPRRIGQLRGRRANRYLHALLAPQSAPLLGFPGPAAPYWTVTGAHPSLALVAPELGPAVVRRNPGVIRARFRWGGRDHSLPVACRRLRAAFLDSGRPELGGEALARRLGFRPRYLLLALTRPRLGHCYKTVAAALPPP
jgi:hypothetical protein